MSYAIYLMSENLSSSFSLHLLPHLIFFLLLPPPDLEERGWEGVGRHGGGGGRDDGGGGGVRVWVDVARSVWSTGVGGALAEVEAI